MVAVRVLGPVELVGAEGPVRLAAMPRRLLAALLVERGRTRSVDVLVEALWPERAPREAAKALQLYVSRLRKALPLGARIRTDSSGYAFELDESVLDAARFERRLAEARTAADEGSASLAVSLLDRALALWRGQAFGELAYEDFARAEAERLEELRVVALEERSEAQLQLGRHAAVVGELRELAVAHPLRERMQAQLMVALYRCGRQTEALDVYASLQERLRGELGLEPGGELRELQRRILQHDPTLAIAPVSAEHLPGLPTPPNRLLGRERELEELAAGRTRTLTPRELLDRLEPRLPLLTGGPRDLPARQQTLRSTLEWSYDLLDGDGQRDLRCLAVFAGGCTLEAAEAVCETTPERLATLVEHNLLQHHTTLAGSRYTMLETIREYAAEQLEQTDEAENTRRRHAEWCCELAEGLRSVTGRLSPRLHGEEGMRLLREEYDNIQSALAWTWAQSQDELRLRLGAACFRMWIERALFHDAVAWLEDAEPRIPFAQPRDQVQALKVAGLVGFHILADTERADRYWADALAVAEQLGDAEDTTWLENRRAGTAWERGELERALAHWENSARRARERGDGPAEADALHLLGEVLRDLGRFDEAERTLLDADALCRSYRGPELFLAANTHSLGDLALDRGDLNGALSHYRQSINELRGRAPGQLAACLAGIASVLVERAFDEDAAKLWGAVCAAERTLGFRMLAAERRRYEKHLARLEDTPAWRAGKALTLGGGCGGDPQAPACRLATKRATAGTNSSVVLKPRGRDATPFERVRARAEVRAHACGAGEQTSAVTGSQDAAALRKG